MLDTTWYIASSQTSHTPNKNTRKIVNNTNFSNVPTTHISNNKEVFTNNNENIRDNLKLI